VSTSISEAHMTSPEHQVVMWPYCSLHPSIIFSSHSAIHTMAGLLQHPALNKQVVKCHYELPAANTYRAKFRKLCCVLFLYTAAQRSISQSKFSSTLISYNVCQICAQYQTQSALTVDSVIVSES